VSARRRPRSAFSTTGREARHLTFKLIPACEEESHSKLLSMLDGRCLAQSNAIMRYLARGSRILPDGSWAQAKIDEWLFWEQYSHEPSILIAVCHFHMLYQGKPKEAREAWRVAKELDFLESALADGDWLTANTFTIADIALIAYTRLAHEGSFDLSRRPNLQAWVGRCEDLLGVVQRPGA
jgi:glutathione S-transferase